MRAALAVRARFELPLYRNGYALVASSALTSVLGLVYWVVAARSYSTAAVGVSAALISAMTLLANISQLNLKGALNRFLPRAGTSSTGFVARAYVIALAASALAACIFLAGLGLWAPDLAFLTERPELALWFVAATMAWTVFVLQDSVLAGIRQASWVPAENLVFAVAKIVLLVVLAASAPVLGAFLAWSAPALLLILPVNALLFRRLIPRHVRATAGREESVSGREVSRYVAADYAAYAIWSGTIGLLPLVVLGVAGPEANAYFFVSWAIAYSLYLISSGMGMSLLAEASLDPDRLSEHTRRAAIETARLVVPAVVLVVAAAPQLLGLLGDDYSGEAVALLRLLALSALPFIVVAAHVNAARVERRMRSVVATYAGLCLLVLAIGIPLLVSIGITGVGIGWLVAQSTVALVLVGGRVPWLRLAASGRNRLRSACRRMGGTSPRVALKALAEAWPAAREWRALRTLPVLNDTAVSLVGPRGFRPAAVLKQAATARAGQGLKNEERALLELRRDERLAVLRPLLPQPLAVGTAGDRQFLVETVMPGTPAVRALHAGLTSEGFIASASAAVRPLHHETRRTIRVDEALLREWIDEPIGRVAAQLPGRAEALGRVAEELRGGLDGAATEVSQTHGDLCPANVLVREDGAVEALVDWEQASARGLPEVDLMHLLLTTRCASERKELGAVVAEVLAVGDPAVRRRALLAWLWHVDANLAKSARYGRSRVWAGRNVDPVLAAVLPSARRRDTAAALATAAPAAVIGLGLCAWLWSLAGVDPRAMSDTGLVSVLPAGFVVAVLALTGSFAWLVRSARRRTGLIAANLLALVAVLHATPPLVYETLRYSWAWKHVGVVDYIVRHGAVETDIAYLGVYHNWPGFFGIDALLSQLAGLGDVVGVATWAPLVFNLLNLAALVYLFSGLTRDRRIVWIASWIFLVGSWVGQDYFSPQAFAFFLYLVLLGVVVRRGSAAVALLLSLAIVVTHPLTGIMCTLALVGLTLARVCVVRWLPIAVGCFTILWDVVFAADFVDGTASSTLSSIRLPWTTTESSLSATGQLSDGQQLVAVLARGLSAAVIALALAGALRMHRRGELNRAAALLALAPLLLFASGDYDGEILFRIYLFSLPLLAFFAAHAFRSAVDFAVVACVLAGLFLFAHYGKDRQYFFTHEEVAASRYLYSHARPGTLIIEGSRNYPGQFANYERFDYLPLSREPAAAQARIVARPATVLEDWMEGAPHNAALLIITRGQKAEVDDLGVMRPGSLARIERALLRSPRFSTVYRNRDATIFRLARSGG